MNAKRIAIGVVVVVIIAVATVLYGGWFRHDNALQGSGTVEARNIRVGSEVGGRGRDQYAHRPGVRRRRPRAEDKPQEDRHPEQPGRADRVWNGQDPVCALRWLGHLRHPTAHLPARDPTCRGPGLRRVPADPGARPGGAGRALSPARSALPGFRG